MNRFIKLLTFFVVLSIPYAKADDRVLYINGIQNTIQEARYSYRRMQNYLDASINHINRGKKTFTYLDDPLWNPTGWNRVENTITGKAEDGIELFLLKTYEELYTTDMKKLIVGNHFPRLVIDNTFTTAARNVASFADLRVLQNRARNTNLIDKLIPADSMDSLNQARENIYNELINGRGNKQIVVAHSQGNLLVNFVYTKGRILT